MVIARALLAIPERGCYRILRDSTWQCHLEVNMTSTQEIEQLRERLGIAGGTLVTQWLSTAFEYFRDVLHVSPLDPSHLQYLRGIDFHRPVTVQTLNAGTPLVRFPEIQGGVIQAEKPKAYRFFSVPGSTPAHLGWNPDEAGFQLYRLRQPVRALVSSASAIRFRDSRSRLGGDRQVVIPWTTPVDLLRERDFDREKMAELFRAGYLPLGLS